MLDNTEQAPTSTALAASKYTREETLEWYHNHIHPDEQRRRKAINISCPAYPQTPVTYGPTFDQQIDGQRLQTQIEKLASFMGYCRDINAWVSLAEIEEQTGIPQSSASAQLRHLRKPEFGNNIVEKRRRSTSAGGRGGTWEYMVVGNRYGADVEVL